MSTHLKSSCRASLLGMIALLAFSAFEAQAQGGAQGLRFNSPTVLDLAERTQKATGAVAPVTALAPAEAEKILAAPTLSEEQPSLRFSDDIYGCKKPSKACSTEHERKLIGSSNGAIQRAGKRLTIVPVSAAPAIFIDWKMATTKSADGDEETHWYLGRLDGNGYHRVEVQFGQDAPGSFLLNPQSGKISFVHNGSDVVVPAADGMHLLTFNSLNTPLSIRVAALDAAGPSLELQCEVGKDNDRVQAQFKGWHDARSFDLAIENPGHGIAARVALGASGWGLATSNPAALVQIGFTCHAAVPLKR
jgi:hypothetical protein